MVNTAFAIDQLSNNHSTFTSLSAGAVLAQERVHKGITIEQIAKALCIRQTYLRAIEEQDINQLPETVYALGFVRSYARYLDLPEQTIVDRFKNEVLRIEDTEDAENLIIQTSVTDQNMPSKKWWAFCTFVLTVLFSFVYYQYYPFSDTIQIPHIIANNIPLNQEPEPLPINNANPLSTDTSMLSQTSPASLPAVSQLSPTSSIHTSSSQSDSVLLNTPTIIENVAAKPTIDGSESKPAIEILAAEKSTPDFIPASPQPTLSSDDYNLLKGSPPTFDVPYIKIIAKARSWVEIKNSKGIVITNRTFIPGEEYIIAKESDLILTTGNIGGLQFIVEGQELPQIGNQGMPKRNIPLKKQYLKDIHKNPHSEENTVKTKHTPEMESVSPATSSIDVMPSVISPALRSEARNPLSFEE